MLLILFLPGLNFLYKEFSLRNRGLLLLIIGTISYIFSVIRTIVADEGIITPYSVYTTIFLTLIFIVPAIFHILLETFKEDVIRVKKGFLGLTYYVSIVGITFIISLLLFGFGDTHQEYINRKFVISLGLGFLISLMTTGTILVRTLLLRIKTLGGRLPTILARVLILAVIIISFMLVYGQIFPLNMTPGT